MTSSSLTPRKDIESIFQSAGLRHFAIVDPLKAFSDSNELWKTRYTAFKRWVDEKKHGTMTYLEQNRELRARPLSLLPETKSAIVFLVPYSTGRRIRRNSKGLSENPLNRGTADCRVREKGKQGRPADEELVGFRIDPKRSNAASSLEIEEKPLKSSAQLKTVIASQASPEGKVSFIDSVARYARHKDYHKVIKQKVTIALQKLRNEKGLDFQYKIAIDSVPFLDRAHAELAGLGFIGKNTMLIRPGLGSYFFIASVLLDLDLCFLSAEGYENSPHSISRLSCNSCKKCVEACPTQALDGSYRLDATRCFSYWSIESRQLPPDFVKPAFKDLFFGCDVCQQVCPYNEFTLDERSFPEFLDEAETLQSLSLEKIATMSKKDYENWFGGLPLTRAKYSGLVRNALYALAANADQKSLQKACAFWESKRLELESAGQFDQTYSLIFEALADIL